MSSELAGFPLPNSTALTSALRLIASEIACRTCTSLNGATFSLKAR